MGPPGGLEYLFHEDHRYPKLSSYFFLTPSDRKLCFCFLRLEIQPSDGIHLNHFTLISHYRPLKVMCDVCLNNARRLGIKYR